MNLYFLLNSLAGGGAEKVAVNLSKILPVKRFLLLEREIKYEIPEEKIVFLSNHTTNTNPILKTFYIPVYALSNIFSPCLKIIEGQHLNKHDLYHKNSPDDRNFYFSCKHIGQSSLEYFVLKLYRQSK